MKPREIRLSEMFANEMKISKTLFSVHTCGLIRYIEYANLRTMEIHANTTTTHETFFNQLAIRNHSLCFRMCLRRCSPNSIDELSSSFFKGPYSGTSSNRSWSIAELLQKLHRSTFPDYSQAKPQAIPLFLSTASGYRFVVRNGFFLSDLP
jgi:hypothetical protein